MLTGSRAFVGPFHVTIDVSSRCNLRCLGCRYQDNHIDFPSPGAQNVEHMSVDLIRQLTEDLRPMGTNALILTGEGDPFLHPRLFDIISLIKTSGYHLTLRTNGTLLDERKIHQLIDDRVDILKVSLWATSPEEYQTLYPGVHPANFAKTLNGLRLVDKIKRARASESPRLVIHDVINKHNYMTLDKMIELAHDNGVNAVYYAPFKAWRGTMADAIVPNGESERLGVLFSSARSKAARLGVGHNINGAQLRFKIGNNVWDSFPCYIGWFHARIKLDGTVLPCDPYNIPMGNLNHSRMKDIWNSRGFREFRRRGLTLEGLAQLKNESDCGFCCHLENNQRVHHSLRWLRPLLARTPRP